MVLTLNIDYFPN